MVKDLFGKWREVLCVDITLSINGTDNRLGKFVPLFCRKAEANVFLVEFCYDGVFGSELVLVPEQNSLIFADDQYMLFFGTVIMFCKLLCDEKHCFWCGRVHL